MDILQILVPIVVTHVIVLVAIIIIIKRLLLGDTMRAMERISQVEVDVRKREESIRREIEEHEKEFAKRKAEAEEEIQKRTDEAQKEATRHREQTISEARKEADRILENATKSEERIRAQVMLEIEEKAVEYGVQVIKLVFSDKITAELDKHFIDELLDALEQVDASSITVDTSQTEFITSHPLDMAQKARLEGVLAEKFGASVKVQEKIRQDLLAGMIIKLGSLEIDGSLLNRCQEAAAEVKKTLGRQS